jgi:hypothetical protein
MSLKGSFFFIFLYEMGFSGQRFSRFDSRIYENEHRFPFYLYVYLYCVTEMETIVRYLQREYWRQDQVRFQLGHSYKITVKFETITPQTLTLCAWNHASPYFAKA